jgi:DNA (cytosine-5)-methyltransferase 1
MAQSLVLSLFPGIGLLDMAFELEGFCVVRGPDLLWGGDIHRFHPPAGKFDGVIGGPPCQAHSRMRHLVLHCYGKIAEDLIPEFERCVAEAGPSWFLMENVEDAPAACVDGYRVQRLVVNARWCGSEQQRLRAFCYGSRTGPARLRPHLEALEPYGYEPPVMASDGKRRVSVKIGGNGKVKATHKHAIKAGMSRRDLARSVETSRIAGRILRPFTLHRRGSVSRAWQRRAAPDGARDRESRETGIDQHAGGAKRMTNPVRARLERLLVLMRTTIAASRAYPPDTPTNREVVVATVQEWADELAALLREPPEEVPPIARCSHCGVAKQEIGPVLCLLCRERYEFTRDGRMVLKAAHAATGEE